MATSKRRLSTVARKADMQIEEAEALFLAHQRGLNHSQKQIDHYQQTFRDLDRYLAHARRPKVIKTLTTATLEAFGAWLKNEPRQVWRGSTVRSIVGVDGDLKDIRAFLRWLHAKGYLPEEVEVSRPKLPRHLFPILSDQELATLWQSPYLSRKSEAATRNRAIFALLLDTGMRLGECAGLTPDRIHPGFVRVLGKGDKERLCPLTDEAGRYLYEWLQIRATLGQAPDDPTAHTIFQLTDHGIGQVIERLSKATGVKVFPHKIRHSAATLMLRRGMDLYTVKQILGHSSINTTIGYLSLCPEDIRAKHQTGSPFLALTQMLPKEETPLPKKRRLR